MKKANEDLVILSFKRLDSEGCTNSPISVSPPLKGCDAEPKSSITELESASLHNTQAVTARSGDSVQMLPKSVKLSKTTKHKNKKRLSIFKV